MNHHHHHDTVMQGNTDDDDFNYSDIENDDDADDEEAIVNADGNDENNNNHTDTDTTALSMLLNMMEAEDWATALSHITHHPASVCTVRGAQRRTPLHLACHHDAPAVVIQALLQQYPAASVATGTSGMNPLHITCSSPHASAHVVRVLHEWGRTEQFAMRDIDGDTPLHAACRCGASVAVLRVLLRAYPAAVTLRDYEGLTPLLRLWVRYYVMIGTTSSSQSTSLQLRQNSPLWDDAWEKTCVILQTQHPTSVLHAAARADGPRAVVHMAAMVLPDALDTRDAQGYTPLHMACQAPVYPVRDLSDGGYRDVLHKHDETSSSSAVHVASAENAIETTVSSSSSSCETTNQDEQEEPSVIRILLQANHTAASQGACLQDPSGRYPLHLALEHGKTWRTGVQALVQAYPEALVYRSAGRWLPFQLAALRSDDLTTVYHVVRNAPQVVAPPTPNRQPPAAEANAKPVV